MRLYGSIILVAAFLAVFIQSTGLRARSRSEPRPGKQEQQKFYPSRYFEDERLVEEAIKNRDLDQLRDLVNMIEKKYAHDIMPFSQLLSRISNALSSYEFSDKRQYLYSEEIARKVLARADEIPIDTEFEMIRQLRSDSKYLHKLAPVSEWPADRAQRVLFLVHLVKRFNTKIDRSFDFDARSNRPLANVCPKANYLCGIVAEQIKEPKIKAQYLADIEANAAKGRAFNLQYKLHQMDKELTPFVDRYLTSLFSRAPMDMDALERSITDVGLAGSRKDVIVGKVREAFSAARH